MASTTSDSITPIPLALHGSASPPRSAAMSSRPTASSSSTAAAPGQRGELDISKLDISSPHELTAFVDDVLSRLEATFDNMSTQVLDRLETISKRIDSVEMSISDLMQGNTLEEASEPAKSSSQES